MAISFACSGCGKQFSLADELAGRRIQCRCGQQMRVPSPAATADRAFGLSELEPADPMASLLEGEAVPAGSKLPPITHKPLKAAAAGPKPPKVKVDHSQLAKVLLIPPLVLGLIIAVGYLLLSTAAKFQPGYESPQAVLAAYQQALVDEDWPQQFRTLDSESQEAAADQLALFALTASRQIKELQPVLTKYQISAPASLAAIFEEHVEPPPGPEGGPSATTAPAAATAKADSEEEAPEVSPEPVANLHLAAGVVNKLEFYVEVMKAIAAFDERTAPTNPLLKLRRDKVKLDLLETMSKGTLSQVTIDGDRAQGTVSYKLGKLPVDAPVAFQRINGRWFLHRGPMEEESFVNLLGAGPLGNDGPGLVPMPF